MTANIINSGFGFLEKDKLGFGFYCLVLFQKRKKWLGVIDSIKLYIIWILETLEMFELNCQWREADIELLLWCFATPLLEANIQSGNFWLETFAIVQFLRTIFYIYRNFWLKTFVIVWFLWPWVGLWERAFNPRERRASTFWRLLYLIWSLVNHQL